MDKQLEAEYQKLNAAQKQAVDMVDGPLLVVAGAGTGKTRVIVERIARLIEKGVDARSILALTFTEKAAGEMLDRVNAGKTGVTLDATIATFNRFGHDLLRTYGSEYGLGRLRLLGDTGQLVFLREHLDELELDYFAPVSNPDGQLGLLADYVSILKQQLITPKRYAAYAAKLPASDEAARLERQKHQELAVFFETYLNLCRREQMIDYDDHIYLTIEMLDARPNILKDLREQYRYILVDEFQDTNPIQTKLIDVLAGKSKNIMVVGDDDQSIYGWRGATLANILEFKKRYPKSKEVALIENYRSAQAILDSAYRLIQHNNPHRLEVINKIDKRLQGQIKGKVPRLRHFISYGEETAWVAKDIERRLAEGQKPGSIAVLARRNQGVQKIHEALELYGVPHVVAGLDNDIYEVPAVRQLLEALKCVADPYDDMALFHTLSGPLFAIDVARLSAFSGRARREHSKLCEILRTEGQGGMKEALAEIDDWRLSAREQTVGNVAYNIISDTKWKKQLYKQAEHEPGVFTEVQALAKFFKTLKEFERVAGVASVQEYIGNLTVLKAAGNQFLDVTLDIADNQVNVLSVHRAKGLEWQTIYIVDCTEGSFPLSAFGGGLKLPDELRTNPNEADEHMAEERRLMYVAVTRAKKEAILSYSDRHDSGAPRKPSRFLNELGGIKPEDSAEETDRANLELYAPRVDAAFDISLPEAMLRDGRLFLSVSQIECWLRCPQDFYYRYILNMPLPPAPQLAYGSLIHEVIERVHQGRQGGHIPSLEELTKEMARWLPMSGYPSRKSRERAHSQAIKTIKSVYERFLLDDLPIESEWPFSLELADMPLTIKGKIDAIYQLEHGVEIRDFKTGTSIRTAEQAQRRVAGSQQLTLYAFAWQQLRGEMPAKLTLDFVETGQIGSIKKQPKSLETLKGKLKILVKHLKAKQYPYGHDHSRCMHPVTSG